MKGIVFNLLEQVVTDAYGEDAWEDLLDDAGVDGVYTSLGSYADEDLLRLVGAASEKLDKPPDDIVRWFGRSAIPHFAARYPQLFHPHSQTRPFVLTLNSIIHPEVRKLYPGATVPDFEFDSSSPDALVMAYSSPRQLCAFAEGLLQGAAEHFAEVAEIAQPECMKRGDDRCLLKIQFKPTA
jgi:hypothetical protein